jgi:hypothetical protein
VFDDAPVGSELLLQPGNLMVLETQAAAEGGVRAIIPKHHVLKNITASDFYS